jgi:hypothetical protein
MRARAATFALPLLALAAPAPGEEAVSLRLRLQPGDTFRETVLWRETRSPILKTAPPVDRTASRADELTLAAKVEAGSAPGSTVVRLAVERVKVDIRGPKTFSYDSASGTLPSDPDGKKAAQELGQILGREAVAVTLDASGKVQNVQTAGRPPGGDGLSGRLIDNPLSGVPGLHRETPVKPGNRWTHEFPSEMSFQTGVAPLLVKVEHELRAVEGAGADRTALVVSTYTVTPGPAKPPAPGAPATAPCTVNGEGSVTSRIHLGRGCIEKAQGVLSMVIYPQPESAAPDIKKVLIRQELEITLVK